jgi:hypothetical protein
VLAVFLWVMCSIARGGNDLGADVGRLDSFTWVTVSAPRTTEKGEGERQLFVKHW